MKKLLFLLFLVAILFVSFQYNEEIVRFVVDNYIQVTKKNSVLENNTYASSTNFEFVQLTEDFTPRSKKDIINIYYTIINSGMEEFSFYCPSDYKDCLNDVEDISDNQNLLSGINNYVPVFNSFKNIETEYDTLGKVIVRITHTYSEKEQKEIMEAMDKIEQEVIRPEMSNEEKIKTIHDYIINHTKYDKDRSDNQIKQYKSDTAYGALIEHYAICGGYADAMKLFLDRFGIKNYKVASENHIWNLVYENNNWVHLDLTWDDPITDIGTDVIEYDYYMITTEELHQLETDQHIYNVEFYPEAK